MISPNSFLNTENCFFDEQILPTEVICLPTAKLNQAREISSQVTGEAHQWRTYLNALALFGFEQWLKERKPELLLNSDRCSLFYPHYANVIDAVCNLQVGKFQVCLLATENLVEQEVNIPRAVVELPDFAAHFYVVIEIMEEQGQVIIRGFLRHQQLKLALNQVSLDSSCDWNYQLSLTEFNCQLSTLLLSWGFLAPTAISLPITVANSVSTSSTIPENLTALLTDLPSPQQKIWQILSWEQGKKLFNYPELLSLLYQWATQSQPIHNLKIRLQQMGMLLTQNAVNTALWLEEKLDNLADNLGFYFNSPQTAAIPIMRSTAKFEQAIAALRNGGIEIPDAVNPTYQDFDLQSIPLRLCAVVATTESSKWSLLLILGNQLGAVLPAGIQLQISNQAGILEEASLEIPEHFVYAIAEVSWGEKLVTTIIPPDGTPLTLHPYTFEPEQVVR